MMTASIGPIRSLDDLRGRRALVLGLARSGIAASRFLADQGAIVTVYDRRPPVELATAIDDLGPREIALALGWEPPSVVALIEASELLVTSPSISTRFPTTDAWLGDALREAEARGTEIVSEIELFLRLARCRVLGVTGTKGKTTSTALVTAMLGEAGIPALAGGNIGAPLVERVTDLAPDDWAVVELSELQLPTISRGADVALYTNITEDHLDRHGSVDAYRAVKARLAELSVPTGRVVLNHDDPGCRELGARLPDGSVAWYGLDADAALSAGIDAHGWIVLAGERLLPTVDVPLPGRHMLADVVGGALAASLAGADVVAIAGAIRGFGGVPHRLETVAEVGGVRWVNDSQGTIPVAAIAALEAFDAPIVLISGGKDKGLDYAEFADAIARRARAAILIGETADELERLVAGRVEIRRAGSMDQAVAMAAGIARRGDVVILAPAAASFDMFVDYAARGDAFRGAVARLEMAR